MRDRSGGFDGGLSTMGPLDSWSDKGSLALGLGKVPLCRVYVSVFDRIEASDVISKLTFGHNVRLTRGKKARDNFKTYV